MKTTTALMPEANPLTQMSTKIVAFFKWVLVP